METSPCLGNIMLVISAWVVWVVANSQAPDIWRFMCSLESNFFSKSSINSKMEVVLPLCELQYLEGIFGTDIKR